MSIGLRKPLGLFLAGGGAWGAWQAGVIDALVRGGLEFDKILGFSAGATVGAGYFLDRLPELLDRWRNPDRDRVMRFSPRLNPFSLLSDAPLWESVVNAHDHIALSRPARGELIVVGMGFDDGLPVYWRFTPGGARGWDGPLHKRLVASMAIPVVFPPVKIEENDRVRTYVDGGARGKEWMRGDSLSGCRDVIIIEMDHPGRPRRKSWIKIPGLKTGPSANRGHIKSVMDSLQAGPEPPRLFHFFPTRALEYSTIAFRSRHTSPAVDQGIADAAHFLQDPQRFLIS